MPPKKAKKAPAAAPPRRSARISSREPSIETDALPPPQVQEEQKAPGSATGKTRSKARKAVMTAPTRRSPSPLHEEPVEKAPITKKYTRIRRELTFQPVHDEQEEKKPTEEKAATEPSNPVANDLLHKFYEYNPTVDLPRPPPYPSPSHYPGKKVTSPPHVQSGSTENADTPPTAQPTASAEGTPGWRKLLTSFSGYFASPFARKRPAEEDDAASPPSSKRTRLQETVAENDDAEHEIEVTTTVMIPVKEPADDTPTQPKKVLFEDTSTAASSSGKRESPREYAGPSAKNPNLATSLSTISERSEPSFTSTLHSIDEASPTPSKPSRVQKRPLELDEEDQQSTPMPKRMAPPRRTPGRTPVGTPLMRRAAQLRAAREAAEIGTPSSLSFFSTVKPAPPKPKETNADARRAKLERMRLLQKELEELEQDEDIKEIQSHRRKRVKIDNLVSIPHNLPGDPSGMFRVPEVDSDDEMEVYDDVEERSNIFEESEIMTDTTPKMPKPVAKVNTPKPVQETPRATFAESTSKGTKMGSGVLRNVFSTPAPTTSTSTTKMLGKEFGKEASAIKVPAKGAVEEIRFDFPHVAPMPSGYHVSEAYKMEALALFQKGFAEWQAAQ